MPNVNEKKGVVIPPLDLEAIKEAIRKRHLMRLDDSDPVLAVATMVEVITEQTAERFTIAMSTSLEQALNEATACAEIIVSKGADHVAEYGSKIVVEYIGSALQELEKTIADASQIQKDLADSAFPMVVQSRANMVWSWWGAFASFLIGGVFTGMILAKFL